MGNVIQGTYTIKEVLLLQNQSDFKTRFDYKKRDKVKMIRVRSIKYFDKDRIGAPSIMYEIITNSTPQYYPYIKSNATRHTRSQTKIKHDYECILQMSELSINTKFWRFRVGKLKKIVPAPQDKIKTIRRETMSKWKKLYPDKIKLNKIIEQHKKKALYISDGDYQAREKGINLDFIYRCMYAAKVHGHLYQRGGFIENRPSTLNPNNILFFPKHMISLIEELMKRGILK